VSLLDRLVTFIVAQYRWGLHPLKIVAALSAPALLVYFADRRLRSLTAAAAAEEERVRRLPRIRRR